MVYITSDFHLDHKNCLAFDSRPFKDLEDQETQLIATWNTTVSPKDTVYHVGDFFWTYKTALRVAPQLNGNILCIKGNHDKSWWKPERIQKEIPKLRLITDQIHVVKNLEGCPPIILCHYPLRSWPHSAHGSWHLYGHVHRKIEEHGLSMCVCLNVNDYNLVSLDHVKATLSARKKTSY